MYRTIAVGTILLAVAGAGPPEPLKGAPRPTPDAVAREYLAGRKAIERKALGMAEKHARDFRRTARAALLRKLSSAHAFTAAEVESAVAGYRARIERSAVEAREAAENAKRFGQVGYVGEIAGGRTVAASYSAVSEMYTLNQAGDDTGIQKLVDRKELVVVGAPLGVRVLEVFDYRSIRGGHFLRVRITTGKAAGEEVYCFPSALQPAR